MLVKFGGACKPRVWNCSGKSRRLPRGYGLYGQGAIDGLLVMESNQEQLSTVFEYDADEAVSKVDGNYELEPRVDRHSPASASASASPRPPNQNPKHKSA